ncbi:hypothetical protein [Gilliamella sp. GillExp13]|uniref:hypothetical protein n=1 Tax=Gilliamella sp. GillExp13 TaxID=3120243 RepID=UPI00080E069D|nr:hypothetical protein [Gilliamella apicola]OCG62259.1 hypothetical protein A9G37_11225 [Gilliamella apicola]
MKQHLSSYSVPQIYRQLNVSLSDYYNWPKGAPKSNELFDNVKALYWQHKARLGAPSLVHDMREKGYDISERTVS